MPLKIACPKCRSQYQVPESAQGKTVKCKKCNSAFKANPSRQRAAQRPAQARTGAAAGKKDLQQFGLDGLRSQPDIFASPPSGPQGALGNFAEDPGFADIRVAQAEAEEEIAEEGMASIVNNPYANSVADRVKKKAAKERHVEKEKNKLSKQPWFLILAVFIPWFMVSSTLSVFLPPVGMIVTVVGLVLLGIVNLIISVWYLKVAFEDAEGSEIVMLFFIPFYAFFFIYNHWTAMKDVMFAAFAVAACLILGIVALTIPPIIGAMIWGTVINATS